MTRMITRSLRALLLTGLALAAPMLQAQVYKWVDEHGRTHYGERKPDNSTPTSKVTIKPSPAVTSASTPVTKKDDWLRTPPPSAKAPTRSAEPNRRSRSGGREDGTDVSRCNLARDILDGLLVHGNGKPLDQHDIDTAKSDVKLFCKKR